MPVPTVPELVFRQGSTFRVRAPYDAAITSYRVAISLLGDVSSRYRRTANLEPSTNTGGGFTEIQFDYADFDESFPPGTALQSRYFWMRWIPVGPGGELGGGLSGSGTVFIPAATLPLAQLDVIDGEYVERVHDVSVQGAIQSLEVSQIPTEFLLLQILGELKKMNLYNAIGYEQIVEDEDVFD